MGLLDLLFGKKQDSKQSGQLNTTNSQIKKNVNIPRGVVNTLKININADNLDIIKHNFVAIDLETTGLSSHTDKIIEVGAVKFIDGAVTDTYGSLIKIGFHIPDEATRVNHITDSMLASQGKEPAVVYKELAYFLADVLDEETYVVAHNANFDIGFLSTALEEYGYSGTIRYLDSLSISRALIKGLNNYKQPTVAEYFGIINTAEHRAVSDAETCGNILVRLLDLVELNFHKHIKKEAQTNNQLESAEKSLLSDEEKEIGAVLLKILDSSGADISKFRFYKNSAKYIDVMYVYTFLKFKVAKKGSYIIIPQNKLSEDIGLKVEECTKSEGDSCNLRVYFDNPFELQKLSYIIASIYQELNNNGCTYNDFNRYERQFFDSAVTMTKLDDIDGLIESAKQRIIDTAEAKYKAQELEQERIKMQQERLHAKKLKDELAEQKTLDAELEKQKMKALLETADSYSIDTIKTIVDISASNNKRAVIKLDDDGNIFNVYESVSVASEDVGIAPKTIRDVCNGRYKHGGGFCWKYADEYINL